MKLKFIWVFAGQIHGMHFQIRCVKDTVVSMTLFLQRSQGKRWSYAVLLRQLFRSAELWTGHAVMSLCHWWS